MSKKKNHERAEREGPFRQRQERKDEPRYHCPFPDCGALFWKEEGKPNCCPNHRKLISDVRFILAHLKPVAEPTADDGPKIFIPKPGMENVAIAEARRAQGRRTP